MYNIIMLKSISSNGCQLLHELCHVFLQFSNVISLSLHKNHQNIRVLHIKMYSNECILAFEIVQLDIDKQSGTPVITMYLYRQYYNNCYHIKGWPLIEKNTTVRVDTGK